MFGRQDNTALQTDNDNQSTTNQDHAINNLIDELGGPTDSGPVRQAPIADDGTTDSGQAAILPMDLSRSSGTLPPVVPPAYHDSVNLPDQSSKASLTDLVDLKTKTLDELYPIIHKLDLSAEDNFKTLMMMIQATDNEDLLSQAYEAAEKIEDEATKAKALLDIVNEINYFTHRPSVN